MVLIRDSKNIYFQDGLACFDKANSPTTYEMAERIIGCSLDRRRNYCIIDGRVCQSSQFTMGYSACYCEGCPECGFSGKKIYRYWKPLKGEDNAFWNLKFGINEENISFGNIEESSSSGTNK